MRRGTGRLYGSALLRLDAADELLVGMRPFVWRDWDLERFVGNHGRKVRLEVRVVLVEHRGHPVFNTA